MPLDTFITPRCGFVAHGRHYGLRADDTALLDGLVARVPLGWQPSPEPDPESEISTWYTLHVQPETSVYRLAANDEVLMQSRGLGVVLDAFASHAELTSAERSRDSLFVHAGVVAWRGQAVVIPGASGSGKTTLVRAFLDAGATYLSDEYAPFDSRGLVRPYPRPLSIRTCDRNRTTVTADALGARTSPVPLPVRAIVITSYEPDAVWKPHRVGRARALVALMAHTIAARRDPATAMLMLKGALSRAIALESARAEAGIVVRHVLSDAAVF
jgi:hypothetical protein